jgi:alkyl hydroperoxide reductase subunit AhpF
MTIIAEKDRPTVRDLLARELVEDVELLVFTRGRSSILAAGGLDGHSSDETHELLEELVGLSDKLHLTARDVDAEPAAATLYNVTAVPTVIVRRRATATEAPKSTPDGLSSEAVESGANLRFLGLPGGYEFSTLLADVIDVSQAQTGFSPDALAAVRAVETPVHIQVFVTPT